MLRFTSHIRATFALGLIYALGAFPCAADSSSFTDEELAWWALQPLQNVALPTNPNDTWSKSPIDHFVHRKLTENNLEPAPQANKRVLIRRLYLDLIGLPPTPKEVDAYLSDTSAEAWSTIVNQLLDDPRYGEHWARFWLDLVRYAESDGWNKDTYRPNIHRYRDYVVNSFNSDKPYPQFVLEQLAGDEIGADDPEDIVATGFLRLGVYEYNQRNARKQWDDIMNEMTDVTGTVFLGLSMSCSRCHDHKFDPILQKDYFSLRAFLEPIIWRDDIPLATALERAGWEAQQRAWKGISGNIQKSIDELRKPYIDKKWYDTADKFPLDIQDAYNKPESERTSWDQQMAYLIGRQFYEEGVPALKAMSKPHKAQDALLQELLAEYNTVKPAPLPAAMSVKDYPGTPSPTIIPGDESNTPIAPGFLTIMSTDKPTITPIAESTGRRTVLAQWIGRADNPLTTRVIVNRIWQQHFTQGLVLSSNDFGNLGEPPSHPELLDWLTQSFIDNNWSFKHLHRLILNSATWQQSSEHPLAATHQAKDPGEVLLWRHKVHRMKAEQLYDAMLLASGELNTKKNGTGSRALYQRVIRNTPNQYLHAFDMANGLTSMSERNSTTTPTQALLLLNGEFALARAKKLAERVEKSSLETIKDKLNYAFQLTWGRNATESEMTRALSFTRIAGEEDALTLDQTQLVDFCHVLLNANEFAYID